MSIGDLKSMSVDQLWELHEQLVAELGRKIAAEKARLEERLRKLGPAGSSAKLKRERRPYPKVVPKIGTQRFLAKLGQAVANNRAGSGRSFDPARS